MKHVLRSSALILSTILGLSTACITSAHADEGDMLRLSQRRLADLGFYSGTFDGLMGPVTTVAIKDFQVSNGLPVTGALNSDTYNLLVSLDYRLYNGAAAKMYVDNTWGYQQPMVVHYADGTAAMATRYVTPQVAHVAYYPNHYANYAMPVTTVPAYDRDGTAYNARYVTAPIAAIPATYVDGGMATTLVSYDGGCYGDAYHRNWHYGDCR